MWPSIVGRNKSETQTLPASEPGPLETDKLELLSAMDIMRDLAEEEVKELMDATPMRTVRKGTMLFGGNDGPEVLFLLKSGRVELSRQPPEGKKLILGFVESGTFFGEMSLIGQRLPYSTNSRRYLCRCRRRQRNLCPQPPRRRVAHTRPSQGSLRSHRGTCPKTSADQGFSRRDGVQRSYRESGWSSARAR